MNLDTYVMTTTPTALPALGYPVALSPPPPHLLEPHAPRMAAAVVAYLAAVRDCRQAVDHYRSALDGGDDLNAAGLALRTDPDALGTPLADVIASAPQRAERAVRARGRAERAAEVLEQVVGDDGIGHGRLLAADDAIDCEAREAFVQARDHNDPVAFAHGEQVLQRWQVARALVRWSLGPRQRYSPRPGTAAQGTILVHAQAQAVVTGQPLIELPIPDRYQTSINGVPLHPLTPEALGIENTDAPPPR